MPKWQQWVDEDLEEKDSLKKVERIKKKQKLINTEDLDRQKQRKEPKSNIYTK